MEFWDSGLKKSGVWRVNRFALLLPGLFHEIGGKWCRGDGTEHFSGYISLDHCHGHLSVIAIESNSSRSGLEKFLITRVGNQVLDFLFVTVQVGGLFATTLRTLIWQMTSFRFRWQETVEQCYQMAVRSLPVVAFSLAFVGLMQTLEFSYHMKVLIRQDSLVPAFSTLLMLREMGPVVGCLLLCSRVGSAIAAEIATMKITEQLDALNIFSIDSIDYLVIPRLIGCVFAAVSLSILSVSVALTFGAFIASYQLHYPMGQYFNSMFVFVRGADLGICLVKATAFGTVIPIIASFQGFHSKPGAQGVGEATTKAVVQGSMLIVILDFFLTYVLYAV